LPGDEEQGPTTFATILFICLKKQKETKNGNKNDAKCGHKLQIMPRKGSGGGGRGVRVKGGSADGRQQQKLSKNST